MAVSPCNGKCRRGAGREGAALARLGEHISFTQRPAVSERVAALFAALEGHLVFDLGNRRYRQTRSTSLLFAAPDLGRVALFEYVGDGV